MLMVALAGFVSLLVALIPKRPDRALGGLLLALFHASWETQAGENWKWLNLHRVRWGG